MTIVEETVTDPHAERRQAMAAGLRELASFITNPDVSLPHSIYAGVTPPWQPADRPDEEKRAEIRGFLGRHLRALARFGADPRKDVTSWSYEVSARFPRDAEVQPVRFVATASGDAVCEQRPVLDDDGRPVMETVDVETVTEKVIRTETRAKTTRHCPPSLLDGLEV